MAVSWTHPYQPDPKFKKRVAYFSMEFAVDQPLKIYSGGLGFLAGSHMRSASDLKQNLIGVGILWRFGYYDQIRGEDRDLRVLYQKKYYPFLEDTGIRIPITINQYRVLVKVVYLQPEIFDTVPMYFLSTDIEENDHLSQTITHKLYDSNEQTRIAQSIVLGAAGAKLVEKLGGADIYHLNEGHGLPAAFELWDKLGGPEEVKKKLVFTTHTPELAGNEEHDFTLLSQMGFFGDVRPEDVQSYCRVENNRLNYTLTALRLSKVANGVSKLHGVVARDMWAGNEGICEIKSITNAQNAKFWQDNQLRAALDKDDDKALMARKRELKAELFEVVADQTAKLLDPDVLTLVWARRFAEYKRAGLILRDLQRFIRLLEQRNHKVQIIWAGKPYPEDKGAIDLFNHILHTTHKRPDCAILTGYEIKLSGLLKKGCDIWLNTPRRPREASGTSGMTASMNAAVNLSINDGWIPELYEREPDASFVLPEADETWPIGKQDDFDHENLMATLENTVVPLYYDKPQEWTNLVKKSMHSVIPYFEADRMATEYYDLMYNA